MKSDQPAFPIESAINAGDSSSAGLTKREYFAAIALSALAVQWGHGHQVHACEIAISYADELIKQLEDGRPR